MYRGDIRLGDTLDFKFTSRRFTTGAPFTLAGSPAVVAYVGNGTTEITAGLTLTADFDGKTGCNHVRVVATSGNGFAAATDVQIVISAGTVDSVSVVGEVVGEFSIEKRSALMSVNDIADAVLKRDWNSVTGEAARSLLNAARAIRNKHAWVGTTLNVYEEDDSTLAWSGTGTTDAAGLPITGIDPS